VATTVYFNPSCSKCRTVEGILREKGVDAEIVRYLDAPPSVEDLRRLMAMLGIDDPRQMMRSGEAEYRELGLDKVDFTPDELLAAIAKHPILLERPIVVRGDRAVIARPPERVSEVLEKREAVSVRNGIVQGEPGIFPWPFGHWWSRLGRWWHRRHAQEQASARSADPPKPESESGPGPTTGGPSQRGERGEPGQPGE
jgi:arsenate reductase